MKHITKSILLLTLLAAVTILTGCPKEPADSTAEKGTWSIKTFSETYSKNNAVPDGNTHPFYFSTDVPTQEIQFFFDCSEDLEAASYTDASGSHYYYEENEHFTTNYYKTFDCSPFSLDSFIGFEGTAKKTAGHIYTGYGFEFFMDVDSSGLHYSWYSLSLENSKYNLRYHKWDDTENDYIATSMTGGWRSCAAIKPNGQENTIKVATRQSGLITVYINGVLQYTFTPIEGLATSGSVYALASIGFEDTVSPTLSDVEIEYKFNKFQKD